MLTAPSGLKTWLGANNVTWRADLLTLVTLSGAIFRWTTASMDLTVGGYTFSASGGGSAPTVKRGTYSKSGRLKIDTLDFTLGGPFVPSGYSQSLSALAAGGLFFGATLQVDHLIQSFPGDVGTGGITAGGAITKWFSGNVSQVEPQGPNIILRCKSVLEKLSVLQLPRFIAQAQCNNALYDANCTLSKSGLTLTGVASGTPTTTTVPTATAGITAKVASYFNLGVILFTSGSCSGLRRSISAWDGTTFTLGVALPTAPASGDGISVYPGCDRALDTCTGKFGNTANFRGYPWIPSAESA